VAVGPRKWATLVAVVIQVDAKTTRAGSGSRAKQDYWGAQVLVNADGQSFDTVMAAINSSRCATCDVTLVVERQKGADSKVSLPLSGNIVPHCFDWDCHSNAF